MYFSDAKYTSNFNFETFFNRSRSYAKRGDKKKRVQRHFRCSFIENTGGHAGRREGGCLSLL